MPTRRRALVQLCLFRNRRGAELAWVCAWEDDSVLLRACTSKRRICRCLSCTWRQQQQQHLRCQLHTTVEAGARQKVAATYACGILEFVNSLSSFTLCERSIGRGWWYNTSAVCAATAGAENTCSRHLSDLRACKFVFSLPPTGSVDRAWRLCFPLRASRSATLLHRRH